MYLFPVIYKNEIKEQNWERFPYLLFTPFPNRRPKRCTMRFRPFLWYLGFVTRPLLPTVLFMNYHLLEYLKKEI